ncbi:Ser/Thr protein kinase RdoA (MazF antagonist) [Deinococcus sp. HSC-46F16]|uniref:phosphotransferase enzyme family protein n=1 Tax=Deinococcus sp. HSC-46F16 TaxID=2910968 RepID=UPI00209CC094|nr:aminoglycoside phosphotransferase family protein [Deinococcus sp. HSC-46F16]MCP2014760.1 Ser/Thr protein kinase RdoA (MazF antagonist) [Deinococcus sp. HSC-46F16]
MAAEPPISLAALRGAVRGSYGLDVETLSFLPQGTAPAYRAEGSSGRWFLKLLPDTPSGHDLRRRVQAERPLLRALRETGVLTRVPRPIPTNFGSDLAEVDGYGLALYGWIDGTSLGADWAAALPEIVPLLGRLHAGTLELLGRVQEWPVPPEDFALPFEVGLLGDLARLRTSTVGDRAGVVALRDLLLPHEATLRRVLAQARTFQGLARAQPRRFVVCHTDAHGGNVMRGAAGGLWLIDWETARPAPPEHDLWMLHPHLPELPPAYEEAVGAPAVPDPDLLGFYLTRRVLEDLAVDVGMILHENIRPEQDEANLAVLERYVLPDLLRVEQHVAEVRGALRLR